MIADPVTAALAAQSVTVPAEATLGRVIAELAGELDRIHTRRQTRAAEMTRTPYQPSLPEPLTDAAGAPSRARLVGVGKAASALPRCRSVGCSQGRLGGGGRRQRAPSVV